MEKDINEPDRIHKIRSLIQSKKSLRLYSLEIYQKYKLCLALCPKDGIVLELGSGGGFIKEVIPEALTSDILAYDGVDQVVDATQMPFPDQSLRAIFMSNVLHHIPDVEAFFKEATRTLKPGGRIFMVDQYTGWFSSLIYRNLHHEPFHPHAKEWRFNSSGALSGANGALACIVFERDLAQFKTKFPLKLLRFEPHTPLRYWWMGGLKNWSLLPGVLFPFASFIDHLLIKISPKLASFVDIELVR